ncbi:MAG: hypothetical protein AB1698_22280 [Pseudomonadota bacterium]
MKPTRMLVVTGLVLALAACAGVPRLDKGPVTAYGQGDEAPRYDSIGIDLRRAPEALPPDGCIQLAPTAAPIRIRELTPEYVRQFLPRFAFPRYWPETWRQKAALREEYQGNGYFVSFEQGRLVSLSLGMKEIDPLVPHPRPTLPALIGPADCSRLHTLPISQEQFIEIFGEPDRTWRTREVYY